MSASVVAETKAKSIDMKSANAKITLLLAWAAMAAAFLAMIPFSPSMGGMESWTPAMNEAVIHHLIFGRDILFTFGPFASVYTQLYNPATYPIMLVGSAILAAGVCSGFALLSYTHRRFLLVLVPFLIALASSRDAIFLSIPFLLMVAVYRISLPESDPRVLKITTGTAILLGILSCAVGTLPLVKVSFLSLAFIEGAVAVAILVLARRVKLAVALAVIAVASLCIGWRWSGQPLHALMHYLLAQGPIVSGYSEAMSVEGPFSEVLFWIIPVIAFVVAFYAIELRSRGVVGLITLAGFALYLLVSFKAGFVRQDLHQHAASAALLFIALATATILRKRHAVCVTILLVVGWAGIEHSMMDFHRDFIVQRISTTYKSTYISVIRRLTGQDSLPAELDQFNALARAAHPLKEIAGTADIYPMQLDVLFDNNVPWSGRPIIQSYSTYRPVLDQQNADHLTGAAAPHTVLFAVSPIDNRLASIEDALSWGLFLPNYTIVGQQLGYIQMERRPTPLPTTTTPLVNTETQTNTIIPVPTSDGVVVARIHMRPTLLGQVVLTAYKLPQVSIELTLTDGRTLTKRYIPEMGDTGFILSPFVATNDDFVAMASGHATTRVKQIRLISPSDLLWRKNIHVTLETLGVAPQEDAQTRFTSSK